MQQLGRKLACGISGRYKPFPIAGSLKSALTSCTFHAPYEANPYAMREYRRNSSRTMLITFAGAFDVCCTGKAIRCKLGARARHVRRVIDAITATDKTTTTSCARAA